MIWIYLKTFAAKTQKKEKPQEQNLGEKQEVKDNEKYEEAAKLGEKYY